MVADSGGGAYYLHWVGACFCKEQPLSAVYLYAVLTPCLSGFS